MIGNVNEWTSTLIDNEYYGVRGGAWRNNRNDPRVAPRYWYLSYYSRHDIEFRVVSPVF